MCVKIFARSVASIFLFLVFHTVQAADRVSVGVGDANGDVEAYRIGLQHDFTIHWLRDRGWGLTGFWELSLNRWEDTNGINALALSPVFIYSPNRSSGLKPYIEGGVGIAVLSGRELVGDDMLRRDLSSTFQFEDRIGVGLRFGRRQQHDLNFRFLHYSNADIKKPNDGLDIFMLSYAYAFSS